jgi:hypothetical protein
METGKSIKEALSTGNADMARELARDSQSNQQGLAYEFIADLIEYRHPRSQAPRTHYPHDRSSAA